MAQASRLGDPLLLQKPPPNPHANLTGKPGCTIVLPGPGGNFPAALRLALPFPALKGKSRDFVSRRKFPPGKSPSYQGDSFRQT
jgi:hypothetical protein